MPFKQSVIPLLSLLRLATAYTCGANTPAATCASLASVFSARLANSTIYYYTVTTTLTQAKPTSQASSLPTITSVVFQTPSAVVPQPQPAAYWTTCIDSKPLNCRNAICTAIPDGRQCSPWVEGDGPPRDLCVDGDAVRCEGSECALFEDADDICAPWDAAQPRGGAPVTVTVTAQPLAASGRPSPWLAPGAGLISPQPQKPPRPASASIPALPTSTPGPDRWSPRPAQIIPALIPGWSTYTSESRPFTQASAQPFVQPKGSGFASGISSPSPNVPESAMGRVGGPPSWNATTFTTVGVVGG
ncbi:hypothetical protein EJ08DRAFT_45885 [Tothia fuscella]|uniref:Uncharacterized protein n=1 Tax=Tothia fuscella TaxID=1048955 RepID=A0A9P4NFJ4_9PEZI|nr:hypothetical protein EJ08DRAFT_45885 [Tothia fuscella]